MKNLIITNLVLFCLLGIAACSPNPNKPTDKANTEPAPTHKVGGGCGYKDIDGMAKIVLVEVAPANENNCEKNPQKITFVFTPTNKTTYQFPNFSDTANLRINAGQNPSAGWAKANKITVGATFACSRSEILQGTCTPVVFKFKDIDTMPEHGCE